MQLSPMGAGDRLTVEGYGAGTFKVAGAEVRGSMLVQAERFDPWPVGAIDALDTTTAAALAALGGRIDILLLGTGARLVHPPPAVRRHLREAGLSLEAMTTPAACRTYNVLVAEGRRVAAALIAMPDADD